MLRLCLRIDRGTRDHGDEHALRGLIGKLVDMFQATECANYFISCGYDPASIANPRVSNRVSRGEPHKPNKLFAVQPVVFKGIAEFMPSIDTQCANAG